MPGVQLHVIGEVNGVDSYGQNLLAPGFSIPKWYYKDGLSAIFLEFLNDLSQKMKGGVYPQSCVPLYCPCIVSQALETLAYLVAKGILGGHKIVVLQKIRTYIITPLIHNTVVGRLAIARFWWLSVLLSLLQ